MDSNCRDLLGDSNIVGDNRWAGSWGIRWVFQGEIIGRMGRGGEREEGGGGKAQTQISLCRVHCKIDCLNFCFEATYNSKATTTGIFEICLCSDRLGFLPPF